MKKKLYIFLVLLLFDFKSSGISSQKSYKEIIFSKILNNKFLSIPIFSVSAFLIGRVVRRLYEKYCQNQNNKNNKKNNSTEEEKKQREEGIRKFEKQLEEKIKKEQEQREQEEREREEKQKQREREKKQREEGIRKFEKQLEEKIKKEQEQKEQEQREQEEREREEKQKQREREEKQKKKQKDLEELTKSASLESYFTERKKLLETAEKEEEKKEEEKIEEEKKEEEKIEEEKIREDQKKKELEEARIRNEEARIRNEEVSNQYKNILIKKVLLLCIEDLIIILENENDLVTFIKRKSKKKASILDKLKTLEDKILKTKCGIIDPNSEYSQFFEEEKDIIEIINNILSIINKGRDESPFKLEENIKKNLEDIKKINIQSDIQENFKNYSEHLQRFIKEEEGEGISQEEKESSIKNLLSRACSLILHKIDTGSIHFSSNYKENEIDPKIKKPLNNLLHVLNINPISISDNMRDTIIDKLWIAKINEIIDDIDNIKQADSIFDIKTYKSDLNRAFLILKGSRKKKELEKFNKEIKKFEAQNMKIQEFENQKILRSLMK